MWGNGREVFFIVSQTLSRRPCESRDPYAAAAMMSAVRVVVDCCWHVGLKLRTVVMGPCFRRDDVHGIANRSVLPLHDMLTSAKPDDAEGRGAARRRFSSTA